jgi:hypothetical protein
LEEKEMQCYRLLLTVFLVVLTLGVTREGMCSENAQAMDKARMDAAIKFAETVLKYGRDTYGEKHTPLFVDGLNIDTMKPPKKVYIFKLRSGPRAG